MFPDTNAYFYKEPRESFSNAQREFEWKEIKKLIGDLIKADHWYIEKGIYEPVHIEESQRKEIIEGIADNLKRCKGEIIQAQ